MRKADNSPDRSIFNKYFVYFKNIDSLWNDFSQNFNGFAATCKNQNVKTNFQKCPIYETVKKGFLPNSFVSNCFEKAEWYEHQEHGRHWITLKNP